MNRPNFSIGQIVHHNRFDYRGVVVDVDPEYSGSEEWYEQVAQSRPPRDAPWYHVLVDGSMHSTYVAERHLEPGDTSRQIEHPTLGQFFDRFDGERYHLRQRMN